MKTHIVHGTIAALVSGIVSATAFAVMPAKQMVERVAALEHAWPGLTAAQKAELAAELKAMPGLKLDVVCGDASCDDLAEDIDDAAEHAGIASQLDHPIGTLGYGIGVKADNLALAQQVADAIAKASGGEIKPVAATDRTFGYAIIFVGKHKAI
jgi:hypothetical protein